MFMPSSTAFTVAEKIMLGGAGAGIVFSRTMTGIAAGARVETPTGWRPVETLIPGMRVGTWDGGFATLSAVSHAALFLGQGAELVHVPGGALGNCQDLRVLPAQDILVDGWAVEGVLGVGAVRVPAACLVGLRGIARRGLTRPVTTVTLGFADEEAVFVDTGALIHCGRAGTGAARPDAAEASFFPQIGAGQARALFEMIDAGAPDWKTGGPVRAPLAA